MTIDDLKSLFELLTNKHQLGILSGDEFTSIANLAQRDYFNFLMGHVEGFQPGRPVPRVGLGMGSGVMDKLAPFIATGTGTVAADGTLAKPAGFYRLMRLNDPSTGIEITSIDPSRLQMAVNSELVPIAKNPRYIDVGTSWKVYPATGTTYPVNMEWIAKPTDMRWNFTSRQNREFYVAQDSVHPQWSDQEINHILPRMLKQFGIPFKDADLVGIANREITAGE